MLSLQENKKHGSSNQYVDVYRAEGVSHVLPSAQRMPGNFLFNLLSWRGSVRSSSSTWVDKVHPSTNDE
jgi:hypothetical protein